MFTSTERLFPQPTLALYLGGSGIQVGDALLTQLGQVPAEHHWIFEPFFIDSQEPTIAIHERSRHYCYRDLYQFYEPVYREFRETRFPHNLGANPVINSCDGCGVTRIFGCASLVARRDDFSDLVVQAVSRLKKRRRDGPQGFQVFLTASACGGTGAGMILDAAALVRHLCRHRFGESPRIFLFLLGPRAFFEDPTIKLREEQRGRMAASTYALLKELHHFAQGNPFVSAYRLRDEKIEIGNQSDDDRLFDWVYYVDGRADEESASRSVKEVAWTIAEAQIHLALTEVGRKVAESLPNQREERVRKFPLEFVHAHSRHRLPEEERRHLARSSRHTFLAGLAVRNVRFPADEIKESLRWGWVREALEKALERPAIDGAQEIDRFDRLLGFADGQIGPRGLLADLGLSPEAILSALEDSPDALPSEQAALGNTIAADRLVAAARSTFQEADALLAEIADRRQHAGDPADTVAPLVADLGDRWRDALTPGGELTRRLWREAGHRTTGIGLATLDRLLVRAFGVLDERVRVGTSALDAGTIRDLLESTRERVDGLAGRQQREDRKRWVRLLRRARQLLGSPAKSSDRDLRLSSMARQVNDLRAALIELRRQHVVSRLTLPLLEEAGRQLKRWREEVLQPTLIVVENALTLARNEERLARQALRWHQGRDRRGRWRGWTTVQIADKVLLTELRRGLEDRVWVEDLVLAPLQQEGISRAQRRLTLETLQTLDHREVVELLHAHLSDETKGLVAFLDNGWLVPMVAERLRQGVAAILDAGAEPLVSFSRPAVGAPVQGYIVRPSNLVLPRPFGQQVDQMTALDGDDPLQLGVVTFAYGIPPNTLEGIDELYEQYTVHIGDQKRHSGVFERYPLHVFANAAEEFDEPHAPLSTAGFGVQELLELGRRHAVFAPDDPLHLDIRSVKEPLSDDPNLALEILEKLLQFLRHHPQVAEEIFADDRYAPLRLVFERRRRRYGAPAGNGSPPPDDRNAEGGGTEP